MANYDQSGIPSIVAEKSADPAELVFASAVTPQPLSNTLTGLVREVLDTLEDAAIIVIDPVTRKVTAATGAQGTAIANAAYGTSSCSVGTVTPDSGQSGRSLTYTYTPSGEESDFLDDQMAVACEAAKPRRTVEGLISSILVAEWGAVNMPCIVVDQVNGLVKVIHGDAGGVQACQSSVDAVPVAGDQIQFTLTEPEAVSESLLVFEGGSTGA